MLFETRCRSFGAKQFFQRIATVTGNVSKLGLVCSVIFVDVQVRIDETY